MRRVIWPFFHALILPLFFVPLVLGQSPRLYVADLQTNNFVVGMRAQDSGLFGYDRDTTWTHYGWQKLRDFGLSHDPSNPDYIMLACGNGALRSLDGGQTWRVTTDWTITEVQDVAIDPFRPDSAYIATAYGVWRTYDRGASWDSSSTGLNAGHSGDVPNQFYVQTLTMDRSEGAYILTGGEGGLHRSADGGKTWTKVGPDNVPVRDVQQSSSNPDLWLAGTEDKGVLISRDAGLTWKFVKGPVSRHTIYAVSIDPHNPRVMAAAGFQTGVFFSSDGGASWRQRKRGLPVTDVHALIFDPEQANRLWVGTVGYGVFSTDDAGRNYEFRGLKGAEIWDMEFIGGGQ